MILWVIEVDKVLVIVGLHLMLYTVLFLIRRSLHRESGIALTKSHPYLRQSLLFIAKFDCEAKI